MHKGQKFKADDLIDEFTDYEEKQSTANVASRILTIVQYLQNKQISSKGSQEIGDLLATIAEVTPPTSSVICNFCDAIASICVDREYVQFSDEAINTLISILVQRANEGRVDPSPILRAISSLLYNNTLRLRKYHEDILNVCVSNAKAGEDAYKRACTILGNVSAFSQKSLDRTIYTRSVKFLMQALATANVELMKPALRSLQLLVLDAPITTFDLQSITHNVSTIAFAQGQVNLRFEAVMVLKALANVTKNAFYAQWPVLLTKNESVFDLLKQNVRLAKSSADLLSDMFRGAYNYMYIANNTDQVRSFTTLASQIGEIIDICFTKFFAALQRGPKTDAGVWAKIVKAFAVFVKDVSFDSGRLKTGYLSRVVSWAKENIDQSPDETLTVLKSLLWTSIENKEFQQSFDFIFVSFLKYLNGTPQEVTKTALQAFRRIAYAYPQQCVQKWNILGQKLTSIGPAHAFQILIRLAENHIDSVAIWQEILTIHTPAAFEVNNQGAIQLALQCIGHCGFIFTRLSDGIQRQCLATILGNDNEAAYESVGLLAKSHAPDFSPTFLCDGYRKLTTATPPRLKPLSQILRVFSTTHKDQFESSWLPDLLEVIKNTSSPYQSKCFAFIMPFLDTQKTKDEIFDLVVGTLESAKEASWKWKAASALREAAKFGFTSHKCVSALFEALKDSKSPKLKVRAAEALAEYPSRADLGDLFAPCVIISVDFLVENAHFTFLKLDEQRKLDSAIRVALTRFFFKLLRWAIPRDFNALEESLVTNCETIYDLMCNSEDAPWESITTLYELKFTSIPSDLLEKFQTKAFPIDQ